MNPPLPLPYAPKRTKPLSLWNPLDYLVLLYWVFYFPQALRWYVETFGTMPVDTAVWQAISRGGDPVQRYLALQAILLAAFVSILLNIILFALGLSVDLIRIISSFLLGAGIALLVGTILSITIGEALGVVRGVLIGVMMCILFATVGSIAPGFLNGPILGVLVIDLGDLQISSVRRAFNDVGSGIWLGGFIGSVIGASAMLLTSEAGVATRWIRGIALGLIGSLLFAILFTLWSASLGYMPDGLVNVALFGIEVALACAAISLLLVVRPDAWLLGILFNQLKSGQALEQTHQHCSVLPVPKLRRRLLQRLSSDWLGGLVESEGLLRYTMQYMFVLESIQWVLTRMPADILLGRVAKWCSLSLYDWDIVFYVSVDLHTAMLNELKASIRAMLNVRSSRIPRRNAVPRYNTPVRAACAGFWHLHMRDPAAASIAFGKVRDLLNGEELYNNALAMAAALDCKDLATIAEWPSSTEFKLTQQQRPGGRESSDLLRPQVRYALVQLLEVTQDVTLVTQSHSPPQRNAALNRAIGILNILPQRLADCPMPERSVLAQISFEWIKIMLDSASAISSIDVSKPVASPYVVGAIVPPSRLVGRSEVFDRIQGSWAKLGPGDSLVIYGHRRMGKSSIIRNLLNFCKLGDDTGLAVLNLQSVDWEQGLADLCHAVAFRLWEAAPTVLSEPQPQAYAERPLTTLRSFLSSLHRHHPHRRYVLALDEYELMDSHLPDNEIVTTLRGFTQDYPWLVVALVGLHALEERSGSFYQAIYAWRPIKVGLLDKGGVADVLQVEDDAFPLEYSLDAIEAAYSLTGGQPFLVQLLGDSLVHRFNEQLRMQLNPPPPTFMAADVTKVVDMPQFYEQGNSYFRGIWEQAGEAPPGQQAILRALAVARQGQPPAALQEASGLPAAQFTAALQALSDHDVVVCADGTCRYTVELMRRWVTQQAPVPAVPPAPPPTPAAIA